MIRCNGKGVKITASIHSCREAYSLIDPATGSKGELLNIKHLVILPVLKTIKFYEDLNFMSNKNKIIEMVKKDQIKNSSKIHQTLQEFLSYAKQITEEKKLLTLALFFFILVISQVPANATANTYKVGFQRFTLYQASPEIHTYEETDEINTTVFKGALTKTSGKPAGFLTGTITDYHPALIENENEFRRRYLVFNLKDGEIIATGNSLYPVAESQIDKNSTVVIAVVGGTKKYVGANGQVRSTRNSDGTYTHRFKLIKNHL